MKKISTPGIPEHRLRNVIANLEARGFVVLGFDELASLWKNRAVGNRARILQEFAESLHAEVEGWHESTAILVRKEKFRHPLTGRLT